MIELPTFEFYTAQYMGDSITEDEWAKYVKRAYDALNLQCGLKFATAELTTSQLELVQTAICYQADYYKSYGFNVGTSSIAGGGKSFTVGKVSVSESSGNSASYWEARGAMLSPIAVALLERLGLIIRRVCVC